MKIAVRLDDITPDMDWERFYRFKALLDKYQIKPLIGLVPDNRDENLRAKNVDSMPPGDFWAYVRQLQTEGWEVAMHGFRHIYATKKGGLFPLNDFSEFAGLPYETQKQMLIEGKRLLEEKGIRTGLFMAPAHSYDKNTLKALKEAGFTGLTDGFGKEPYEWMGLRFYPISFKLSRTFQRETGYSTMVVHTGTVSVEDLKRYEGYLERKDAEWISYGEYLKQPPVRRGISGRIREFLMAEGKHLAAKIRSGG